ncbi:MAG: Crp/Fnr family transcriptional regulator [Clostridia bacterium]|nr:Crp/Fnr family transcriptional regulator [Clostridia bacterium]
MKKYIPVLKKTKLFSGVGEEDAASLLSCLGAKKRTYRKGEYILREGEHISDIFILVEGKIYIQNDDYWGNRSILSVLSVGEMFGEAYSSPESGVILNDVVAMEDSTVIFFDVRRILTTCSSACRFHNMIVQNMFFAVSDKNRRLVQKLGHMSGRTTRAKLISYLSEEAKRRGSSAFTVPFNRQQLADYLSVDRSAMSKELCRMRDEGMIRFDKSSFELL